MRRGDHQRAARSKVIDHRGTERPSFVGVRARADFIQQDQRGKAQRAIHRGDVRDVPRKGAQARRNGLLVADVCEHRSEGGHLRAVFRWNVQAGLRHEREQPRALQRDRLAAGIRTADNQHARRRIRSTSTGTGLALFRGAAGSLSSGLSVPEQVAHRGKQQRMARPRTPAARRSQVLGSIPTSRREAPSLSTSRSPRHRAFSATHRAPPAGIAQASRIRWTSPPPPLQRHDSLLMSTVERPEQIATAELPHNPGNGRPVLGLTTSTKRLLRSVMI
jgi:hypothetical protein